MKNKSDKIGMMPIVSYIIPFYNGGKTIVALLDSIYSLPMGRNEVEVIIVDDNSPVSAESVLKDYLITHDDITIIHHSVNKCQGGAKNTGIRAAKGKYIAFSDQDDIVESRNVYEAIAFAIEHDLDMLACHFNVLYEDGRKQEKGIDRGDKKVITGKDFCEHFFNAGCNLAPWSYLYKREFLLDIAHPYEENVLMEDSDWIAWHLIHSGRVGILNIPIYTWVMNPTSITHSLHYKNRADFVKFGYRKIRDARQYRDLSPFFSDVMILDGRNNIIGTFRKIWKVDNYSRFYKHLKSTLPELQNMTWSGIVNFLINYPKLSVAFLYPIGTVLKCFNHARHKNLA